ncbi:hypothetical protein GFB56_19670 [Ensifer sp. T173]|uniref:Uncharacterized protein n=1 Tax=Ensifer canadensis TaxID=555315 RepID=A0AAW4FNX8_9HYPH|nr:hypothetical protein [Ensifer canadensis]MBM3093001.1 hypothetical protein [Ensifer canadensis]UBI80442.1 hypothetical protein J3R84_36845 [Ensifer canadensis]
MSEIAKHTAKIQATNSLGVFKGHSTPKGVGTQTQCKFRAFMEAHLLALIVGDLREIVFGIVLAHVVPTRRVDIYVLLLFFSCYRLRDYTSSGFSRCHER